MGSEQIKKPPVRVSSLERTLTGQRLVHEFCVRQKCYHAHGGAGLQNCGGVASLCVSSQPWNPNKPPWSTA